MCGIVGYIGQNNAAEILLRGLRELEYRGYDSAGIAVQESGGLRCIKAVGKLDNLVTKVGEYRSDGLVSAIGHTRWATHGKPTEANAHPHGLTHSQVVHNGIIENYQRLKESVSTFFLSQTDSEVIVHLFEKHFAGQGKDPEVALTAFRASLDELQGSYAVLLISEYTPGKIYFARQGSPLQVAFTADGCYFSSSDAPLLGHCANTFYFAEGQWGVATETSLQVFDAVGTQVEPFFVSLPASRAAAQKEGFRYFMEKEVYEQPQVFSDILTGRLRDGLVDFEELSPDWLRPFRSITLCACGTSYHAALVGSYLMERLTYVPAKVEIASEFRYRSPVLDKQTLFVVISQSGETADTLEALKLAKAQGLSTLVLCNVDNSSMVREADKTILLRAGIEKGVASTKAFSAQVMTLWMLAIYWGESRGMLVGEQLVTELAALPAAIDAVRVQSTMRELIHRRSKRYLHGHGFFFIGRDLFYPLALEGALKLKEISYLHAEGYPAGEMKHGPIALADAELFTIALISKTTLFEKIKSNVEEISARDSTIVAITSEDFELADDLIRIRAHDHIMLEFFEMMLALQLFAMEVSIRLGNDIDMPRNLAKSVTVE